MPDAATTDAPEVPPDRIVVLWLVNRCPECGRRDFRTVRTVAHRTFTVREHRCRGCALKWRSMDRLDGEDVGR